MFFLLYYFNKIEYEVTFGGACSSNATVWQLLSFFPLATVHHCVKSVHIRSYSGPHFPLIRTECCVSLSIQSECEKMGENADRNNSEYRHFLRSAYNEVSAGLEKYCRQFTARTQFFFFFVYFKNFSSLHIYLYFFPSPMALCI